MVMEQRVREARRQVVDPEIDSNIVDLGRGYGIEVVGTDVHIALTMSTRACPLHEYLTESAQIDVEMVWDPPRNPAMMSEEAKRQLG